MSAPVDTVFCDDAVYPVADIAITAGLACRIRVSTVGLDHGI